MEKLQYLSVFGIIKSAIEIPFKSYSFFISIFLASIPLFLMELISRLFQSYLLQTPYYPEQLPFNPNKLVFTITRIVLEVTIGVLYLLLFDFVKFLVAITTINSASTIYNTGRSRSLRNLLRHAITKTKWRGPYGTFAFSSFLSDMFLEGALYWCGKGPLVSSRYIFLHVVHGSIFALAMIKWWEYSSLWNVGFVISSFEEKFGLEALSDSADLTKGNRIRGTSLMLVHAVWRLFFFLPYFPRRSFSEKIAYAVFYASSLCVETVILWLFLVVYYHDCKTRYKGKMKVEEGGRSKFFEASVQLLKDLFA